MRITGIAAVALVGVSLMTGGCMEQEEGDAIPPGAIPAAPDMRPGADAAPIVVPGDSGAAAGPSGGAIIAPADGDSRVPAAATSP